MTYEEVVKYVKEHHVEYAESAKTLGPAITDRMIKNAIEDDITPACCTHCPYSNDCGSQNIVPWLMTCERYTKYKHTNKVEEPELSDKERIDYLLPRFASLERKVAELQETISKLVAMNEVDKQ